MQMGMELNEILRQQVAQPAKSCASEAGISFLDQVICPLYDVIAAVCSTYHFFCPLFVIFGTTLPQKHFALYEGLYQCWVQGLLGVVTPTGFVQ